jgi:hypothetical protein
MRKILKRTNLPTDFKIYPSGIPYVDDTCEWVKNNYNGSNPLHHLALLAAVIVATSIIPFHHLPPDAESRLKHIKGEKEVRRALMNTGWESKGTRGMSDKSIFVSMITTYIIALYEPQSPLRKNMLLNPKKGLGNTWTTKYSAPFSFLFLMPFVYTSLHLFQE